MFKIKELRDRIWAFWMFSTNHKYIGALYLLFSIGAGMLGLSLLVIMRLELAGCGDSLSLKENTHILLHEIPLTREANIIFSLLNYLSNSYLPIIVVLIIGIPTIIILLYVSFGISRNFVIGVPIIIVALVINYIIYIIPVLLLVVTMPFMVLASIMYYRYFFGSVSLYPRKLLPFQKKIIIFLRNYNLLRYCEAMTFLLFNYPSEPWFKTITIVQHGATVAYVFLVRLYVFSFAFLDYTYSFYLLSCMFLGLYFSLLGHILKLLRVICETTVTWSHLLIIEQGTDPTPGSDTNATNATTGSGATGTGTGPSSSSHRFLSVFTFNRHNHHHTHHYPYPSATRLTFNQKMGLTGGLCTLLLSCVAAVLSYENLLEMRRQNNALDRQNNALERQNSELEKQNNLTEYQAGLISKEDYLARQSQSGKH